MTSPLDFRKPKLFSLFAVLTLLVGCEPSELRLAPAAPAGAGGGGSTTYKAPTGSGQVPASPLAPVTPLTAQINPDDANWTPTNETRAWHAATSSEDCRRMQQTFRKEGRKVTVTGFLRPGEPDLPWVCIVEGPDANPNYQFPSWQERTNP